MYTEILSLVLLAAGAQPVPATVETRLTQHVEAHREEALALIERTVNINSGTMNLDGVRRVGEVLAREFESLGFGVRWIDGEAFGRSGHLVAQWPPMVAADDERPLILLIGHLDTVFEPDSPFQRFVRLSDTAASGPGITDMKGGNVVMLYALKALAETGLLSEMRISVVLTGDEEKSGRPLSLAREALITAAQGADAAIGFEDGDSNPKTTVIARRGSSTWKLEVTGVSAHSSQIFQEEVGAGAIYETARILAAFYDELSTEVDLTFSPGVVVGGTDVELDGARGTAFGKDNVVARRAMVAGDLRALSPEQYARAKKKMQAVVERNLPGTTATLTFSDGYPPMAPTDGNRRLLALYDEVSRDLGYGPVTAVDPRKAGAADVSFVAGIVPMVLDGVGLMGAGGHTVDETADLTTLPMQTSRAAVLIYRLGHRDPSD